MNAIGVDITRPASVSAGSIRIVVTDRGAGVRIAGNGSATDRSFRLTASGKLETIGAEITANEAVDLRSRQAEFLSNDRQTRLTSTQSGVVIETTEGDLDLSDSAVDCSESEHTKISFFRNCWENRSESIIYKTS